MFQVQILESQECFPCGEHQSVLHGMASLGRKGIPIGCRGGACGVCKVEVVSGEYERKVMSRSHVSESDELEGRVLACRIQPLSNLSLKVIGSMKRCMLKAQVKN